jgi:hypothetical protein
MEKEYNKTFKKKLNTITSKLEEEDKLITEAIKTVILIAKLNKNEVTAFDLIKEQFIIISKEDLKNI